MIKDSEEEVLIETGRMAARLIHDFKNQLGGLKLYAAYLKKRFADNPEGLEIADKIVQGLNEMADQAAILSKLSRPMELRIEAGDLKPVVERIAGNLQSKSQTRRVKLECEIESNLPQVSFDLQSLSAALESIIVRAIDSSPENSQVKVSLKRQGEMLLIEIVDEGESLDDQRLEALFDVFVGDRINKTSLGLAMARRIIGKHGGRVAARPGRAAGTVVEVRLGL
jgi:two-component system nitrogen regulation sensor histidine kinase NtrY